MKKICFVTTIYGTYSSFLKELSFYLHSSKEYDISLICDGDSIIKDDVPSFINVFPVKMKRGISFSAISSILEIKKILKENNFDIVQYSTPNAAFYTSIASRFLKVPVRLYCQWGIRYMGFEGLKRKIFKTIEKISCNNSTFIEAESHNIRNFSLEEGLYTKDRSCVIWNGSASGVNLKKFDINSKNIWRKELREKFNIFENDIVFSFAARLTADKGVNELLQAFLNLNSRYKNIKLLIMGAYDNEKSLDADLLQKAKDCKGIIFTGRVSDVEKYYAAADVFVAPSYREGFGLVVIEAESMGLPAIVSNVPGQIDAIIPNETGLSCVVKSASSLQHQMEKLILDSDLRVKFGNNAQKFVRDNFEQNKLFEYLKKHRDELIGETNAKN